MEPVARLSSGVRVLGLWNYCRRIEVSAARLLSSPLVNGISRRNRPKDFRVESDKVPRSARHHVCGLIWRTATT